MKKSIRNFSNPKRIRLNWSKGYGAGGAGVGAGAQVDNQVEHYGDDIVEKRIFKQTSL